MDDFNDPLPDFGSEIKPLPKQERLPDTRTNEQKAAEVIARSANKPSIFNDKCPKCIGGFWKGNRRFPCFACKGKGVLSFKTSPEARAKGRARAAEKAAQRESDKAAWREAHAAEVLWCARARRRNEERGGTFDFPAKLLEALEQWGIWTDAQLAAVQKLMARDQERAQERQQQAPALDVSKLTAAFAKAHDAAADDGEGVKFLRLHIGGFTVTPDKQSAGDVWFKFEGAWVGKTEQGRFKAFRACTEDHKHAIVDICNDPAKAAQAHGLRTGECSCCGRELTNAESRERGIGPICAAKFGW